MRNLVTANEELNQWCGTKGINYYEGDTALGFLFKYAVPKLSCYDLGWAIPDVRAPVIGAHNAKVWIGNVKFGYDYDYEDPALALFWAIYQVIEAK